MNLKGSSAFAKRSRSRSSLSSCIILVFAALSISSVIVVSEAKNEVDAIQKNRELRDTMSLFTLSKEKVKKSEEKVPPPGLTMAEFDELIFTDIHHEFSTPSANYEKESSFKEKMFHLATQLEWKRAYHAEESSKEIYHHPHHPRDVPTDIPSFTSPFLICDYCANKTALTAKREVESMVGSFHMMPVRNDDEQSCFMTQMPPSVADRIGSLSEKTSTELHEQEEEGEWCTGKLRVQPVIPEMKISSDTVDMILDQVIDPNGEQSNGQDDKDDNSYFIFYSQVIAAVNDATAEEDDDLVELGMSILKSLKTHTAVTLRSEEENNQEKINDVPIAAQRFLRLDHPTHDIDTQDAGEDSNLHAPKQQQMLSLLQQNERKTFWHKTLLEDSQSSICQSIFSHFIQVNPSSQSKTISFSFLADEDTDVPSTLEHLQDSLKDAKAAIPSCLLSLVAAASTYTSVSSVDFNAAAESLNVEEQWITQSNSRNKRPFFDVGLTGTNQVVAVSDTGLDRTNCYFMDDTSDEVRRNHRKIIQYLGVDDTDGKGGHGTHVCGTVAGRKLMNGVESTGKADGIARDATIAFYDMQKTGETGLRAPSDILKYGYKVGARIHSASWGLKYRAGGSTSKYINRDRSYDKFMHDNDDLLFISAAGNSGSDNGINTMSSVGSPAVGKNGIAVGGSESVDNNYNGMLGKDYLWHQSSRGPTADGRTKPDVVAPGFYVLSAKAKDPFNDSTRGRCDWNGGTITMGGTSMATPVVSGTAALVREYFMEGYYPSGKPNANDIMMNPSAALVKAVLLNGAQYLKAIQQQDMGTTPLSPYDNNQNFGRIDLIESLPLNGKNNIRAHVVDRKEITDMDSHSFNVHIDKSKGCTSSDFSATLVWTDPPGAPSCVRCLINDLDLFIQKNDDAKRIRPNGKIDRRDKDNNAERIRIEAKHGDELVVTVDAHDLETSRQKYALVMTGCIGEVNEVTLSPTVSPAPTVYDPNIAPSPAKSSSGSNTGIIVGAVVGGVAGLCALLGLIVYCRKKRDEREPIVETEGAEGSEGPDYVALSQDETPTDSQEGGISAEQGELT